MSQNTGVQPQRTIACVVEAKVKGVVIISPLSPIASMIFSSARWPFVSRATLGTPRYSFSSASSRWCFSPILVSQWLSQMLRISLQYSSNSGMDERVTLIISDISYSNLPRMRPQGIYLRLSSRSALTAEAITMNISTDSGRPMRIASTCTALKPPTSSSTKVMTHMTAAQNTRHQRGA